MNPKEDNLWTPAPAAFDDPADLFGSQGYLRGAMTLQALRQQVGSHDFFIILRSWAKQHEYGNVTTAQFIRLSERVSGQDLDAFFQGLALRAEEARAQLVPQHPELSAWMVAMAATHADNSALVGELLGDDVGGRAQRAQRAYGTITRR